jgi:phosphate starvation-inducible PhoH-like protein
LTPEPRLIEVSFDDNRLVPLLYGEHDAHLARIEHQLGVSLASRGNRVTIRGPGDAAETARTVLSSLWERLERGLDVGAAEVDATVRMARQPDGTGPAERLRAFNRPENTIVTRKRTISPRTPGQSGYIDALRMHPLVFGLGPAGTGKTYLAVAQAVSMLATGRVDRLILSRPAVEAGERLGFLPGDMREKVDPYLRPLYDALHDMLPAEQVARHLETGTIEIAPLAFMRGRTLANAFIILDEAQNTTSMQMRMFLTRMGENSRMAVTGDISQVDLPPGQRSGLRDALDILDGIEGITVFWLTDEDVVRHALVTRIVRAYDAFDRRRLAGREEAP